MRSRTQSAHHGDDLVHGLEQLHNLLLVDGLCARKQPALVRAVTVERHLAALTALRFAASDIAENS